jgi:phosphate:Na+ symporter
MTLLLALYLAGLSFFFTGVSGISDNLRQLSGQRFREWLSRATHHPVMAGLLGTALGVVTQSTSVVAFVLSGMTASGVLPMSRALMVLACANLGTAVLVFIATLDLHMPILYLIGISGLILAFKLWDRWKPAFAGVLSIGLVFFGLDMMKQVFKPLTATPGFTAVSGFFDYWPDAAFFVGLLMRTVIHSSAAVAAIGITLNKGGFLAEFQSMMSMAGLGVGTAIATYLLSSNLRGVPRQIALFQAITNVAAGVLFAALFIFERASGISLLIHGVDHLSPSVAGRMAIMYFCFNLTIMLVSLAVLPWAPTWLERLCPPTPEQDLSRPMYLQTEALRSPETALDLVALEQVRLVRGLQRYLDIARGESEFELESLHGAAGELGTKIAEFLDALVGKSISASLAARVIAFQRKEETIRALEDNIYLFAETLHDQTGAAAMANRLVEALDTIVLTAIDALQSKDKMDLDLLMKLTDDRGGMMERLRNRINVDGTENVGNIAALHYATTLFERNVWLLRQLALWLKEDTKAGNRD